MGIRIIKLPDVGEGVAEADLDVPFDDFGLGHALADIGKLDDAGSHVRPPSPP